MRELFFVAGTGTAVGKTLSTGLLAKFLLQSNIDVITAKFVQTGNVSFSEDLEMHRRLMKGSDFKFAEDEQKLTCPQIFSYPASPHLSAALEKKTVDVDFALSSILRAGESHDVLLVELAGGLMVPLREDFLTIDLLLKQNRPVILVASAELGSLNFFLLSLEALSRRNIPLAGVVYNRYHSERLIADDTLRMIRKNLLAYGYKAPVVELPEVKSETFSLPDFSPLFNKILKG